MRLSSKLLIAILPLLVILATLSWPWTVLAAWFIHWRRKRRTRRLCPRERSIRLVA